MRSPSIIAAIGLTVAVVCATEGADDRDIVDLTTKDLADDVVGGKMGIALPSVAQSRTGSTTLVTAMANSRTVSWMHTGALTEPAGIASLPNIEFIPEIAKRQDISDIRNGNAPLVRGGPGLLAFCGEKMSTFEAAAIYPTLVGKMKQPFGSASPNIIVCAESCDWIDSFTSMCRTHQGMLSDEQKELACGFKGIGITSYACNTNDLRMDIERYKSCLGPDQQIWVKEVTCRDDPTVTRDPTQMAQYIKAARSYLDGEDIVARYSFGSTTAVNDNKADGGTDLLDSAALFDGSGGVTPMGGLVLGLPEESSTNPFYSCDNEWGSEFIKKYQDVTKTFTIDGEDVELTKTKKKRRSCEWLSKVSQTSNPGKQLKFNKFCSNEKKARDVCPGVCVGRCRYTEPLLN